MASSSSQSGSAPETDNESLGSGNSSPSPATHELPRAEGCTQTEVSHVPPVLVEDSSQRAMSELDRLLKSLQDLSVRMKKYDLCSQIMLKLKKERDDMSEEQENACLQTANENVGLTRALCKELIAIHTKSKEVELNLRKVASASLELGPSAQQSECNATNKAPIAAAASEKLALILEKEKEIGSSAFSVLHLEAASMIRDLVVISNVMKFLKQGGKLTEEQIDVMKAGLPVSVLIGRRALMLIGEVKRMGEVMEDVMNRACCFEELEARKRVSSHWTKMGRKLLHEGISLAYLVDVEMAESLFH